MSTQIFTTVSEWESLLPEWERLYQCDPHATIYQSPHLLRLWWDAFGDSDAELRIVAVEHNGTIIGIAPCCRRKRSSGPLSWTELRWIGLGDYGNALLDPAFAEPALKSIVRALTEMEQDRMILHYIDADTPLAKFLLRAEPWNPSLRYLVENPFLDLKPYQSGTPYTRVPSNIRKKRRQLQRDTAYRLECTDVVNRSDFDEIRALHRNQQQRMREELNRKERRSLYDDERTESYLSNAMQTDGINRLYRLRGADNRLIAYQACYKKDTTIYFWNAAYDYEYRSYRPSMVAVAEMIEHLIAENRFEIADFGAGRYAWKFAWTDDFRLTYQWEIWADTHKARLVRRAMEWAR